MGLVGAGVERGELVEHGAALGVVVIVDGAFAEADVGDGAVVEHLRLAGLGQHEEFMGVVAADGAAVGAHRDRLRPIRS
jgi:hypothetical protein